METGAFGVNIIESATSGSHCACSLQRSLIPEDAVEALKWKAF